MTAASESYPHLDPALHALADDALQFWGDAQLRHRALDAIITAWEHDEPVALQAALRRVDDAVAAGLHALGLSRGTVRAIRFEDVGRGWRGRKTPDSDLILDAPLVRRSVRQLGLADDVIRTWTHESIHARHPFSPSYQQESREAPGYEEGLAEGLARLVTAGRARMTIVPQSYNRYVAAYETLAEVLDVTAEALWRALWMAAPGNVRQAFLSIIGPLRGQLNERQGGLVRLHADQVFAPGQAAGMVIDRAGLSDGWKRVLL